MAKTISPTNQSEAAASMTHPQHESQQSFQRNQRQQMTSENNGSEK